MPRPPHRCNTCKTPISQRVYEYSINHFGMPLCMEHQRIARNYEPLPLKSASEMKRLEDDTKNNAEVPNNAESSADLTEGEIKIELTLKDPRAIKIVEDIPTEKRNEVIEKYIILGDMVTSYASISANKETVEEFFSPLKNDIDTIREQLSRIVPTMASSTRKGKMTVDAVFDSLREHFMDDSFEDVSGTGKNADILATTADSKIPILIELKDYSGTVPHKEVDKFWRDMERRGTKYGIFISMRSGIRNCSSCITVKTEINRTAVFVNNSELNWSGHLFAYYVIKKIAELEYLERKGLKGEEIEQVVAKLNNHVLELQRNIESIDKIEDIADNLRATCKKKLDELIDFSNTIKRSMNEKIKEIIADLDTVKT
jgi:hypothetical protein